MQLLNLTYCGSPFPDLFLDLFHIHVIHILNHIFILFTPILLLAVIHFYKLLYEHLFIDVLATLGDVDENKQVEDDMPETQEVLTVRFAKLGILYILEKVLDALVLNKVLGDCFFLGKFEQNLDHFAFIVKLIEYLQNFQH